MKLRTLKDIVSPKGVAGIYHNRLREEAKKWVKHHRSYHNKTRDAIAKEIMHLNNLDEGDLG